MFGIREKAGRVALLAAERAHRRTYIPLDYPPSAANVPRYDFDGRPVHQRLAAILGKHEATFGRVLDEFSAYADSLAAIPRSEPAPDTLHWDNPFCSGLDGVAIYGFIRSRRPARYVEVGSGYSTMFAARARDDGGLSTTITSIDPFPRAAVDRLCDVVIRQPLETADLQVFAELAPGDVVFFDGSHRVFMNSDVVSFFLDVLPELPAGVIVGIDDVLLPSDYFPGWAELYYSEQYLLATYLLAEGPWLAPLLPCNYATNTPELFSRLGPLWNRPEMAGLDPRGISFWLSITR
jgi:predicted O-methyltransferase YrrM